MICDCVVTVSVKGKCYVICDCVVIVSVRGKCNVICDCVVIVSVRGEMLRDLRLCGNSFRNIRNRGNVT